MTYFDIIFYESMNWTGKKISRDQIESLLKKLIKQLVEYIYSAIIKARK